MKYIILQVPWKDDTIFIGKTGTLICKPTEFEYGEIEVYYQNNKTVKVLVDFNDYAPYSPLLEELL